MKKRVLVYRLSSMGDVAMLASVMQETVEQNQNYEFIVLSHHFYQAFFEGIENVRFHGFHPKTKHKGFMGLIGLYRELKQYKADYIADMHGNIRTTILKCFSSLEGRSFLSAKIDKGRKDKKEIIRKKILKPLTPTVERYANVFRSLGLSIQLSHELRAYTREAPTEYREKIFRNKYNIGISPFAQWPYKMWSLSKMKEAIHHLAADKSLGIFLFGGGENEKKIASQLKGEHENVINVIGTLSLKEELDLISNLDLMVSMDSSGMHMASLEGVRCLCLWGSTHPYLGFLGYGQALEDCIQVPHPNRPCSVYGDKSCDCDGIEAIDLIKVEEVTKRINSALHEI